MLACLWEILSCLSASQTPNSPRDMSSKTPEPKQVQLFRVSHSPTTKENWIWVPKCWCVDRWGLCVACRQLKPWWNCKCWELQWNNSWKAFCGPESDWTATATVSLWHLAVKLNNTQSSESPDQSKALNSRDAAQGQQTQITSRAATKAPKFSLLINVSTTFWINRWLA